MKTLNLFEDFAPNEIKMLTRSRGWNRRNMSHEERRELGRSVSIGWASRSPEVKAAMSAKISKVGKVRWFSMSKEHKRDFLAKSFNSEESQRKSAEGLRKFYTHETLEHKLWRRKITSKAVKESWELLTPEQMELRLRISFHSNEARRRAGDSNRLRWVKMSGEEKEEFLKRTLQCEESVKNRRIGIRRYHSELSPEEEKIRAENSFLSPEGKRNAIESGRDITHRRTLSKLSKEEMELRMKKSCHSPEGIRNKVKARNMKPNGLEDWVNRRLQKRFPSGEWVYNGDYSQGVSIGLKIPDFINVNGRKEVIETLGGLGQHHFLGDEELLVKHYAKYGYKCHVIWEWDAWDPEVLDSILAGIGEG